MKIEDVTYRVRTSNMFVETDESLHIDVLECICGWEGQFSITEAEVDTVPKQCPKCHRKFLFVPHAVILEVKE